MPICNVTTNIARTDIPEDFCAQFIKVIAETLSKPEKVVCVMVHPDTMMARGGPPCPTLHVNMQSIAVFEGDNNQCYARAFTDFLVKTFGLPQDQVTIAFQTLDPKHVSSRLLAQP